MPRNDAVKIRGFEDVWVSALTPLEYRGMTPFYKGRFVAHYETDDTRDLTRHATNPDGRGLPLDGARCLLGMIRWTDSEGLTAARMTYELVDSRGALLAVDGNAQQMWTIIDTMRAGLMRRVAFPDSPTIYDNGPLHENENENENGMNGQEE